jgi:GGDEF domain-containing protein
MQELQDKLEHQAFHDPLTDLANRMPHARMGGDEFAILLEQDAPPGEAIEVANRINGRLAERFSVVGTSISVGVSTGIATGTALHTTTTS